MSPLALERYQELQCGTRLLVKHFGTAADDLVADDEKRFQINSLDCKLRHPNRILNTGAIGMVITSRVILQHQVEKSHQTLAQCTRLFRSERKADPKLWQRAFTQRQVKGSYDAFQVREG